MILNQGNKMNLGLRLKKGSRFKMHRTTMSTTLSGVVGDKSIEAVENEQTMISEKKKAKMIRFYAKN